MKICMIITAAGMSTRQKQNKLLMRLGDETIIEKTISNFENNVFDIFVVVGHEYEFIVPILETRFDDKIKIIENPNFESGIASSLNIGITAVGKKYDYYGFCNGDKPFIKDNTINKLSEYLMEVQPGILVPLYQEQSGHPTFFKNIYYNDFIQISGDIGGQQVINKYPEAVIYLPVNDEGIIMDMDRYLQNERDK